MSTQSKLEMLSKEEWNEELANFALHELNGERWERKPSISFPEFCADQGVSEQELSRLERAAFDFVCMSIFKPVMRYTVSSSNKHSALRKGHDMLESLKCDYEQAVRDGTIPKVEVATPLDFERNADRAYVRVRYRRALLKFERDNAYLAALERQKISIPDAREQA